MNAFSLRVQSPKKIDAHLRMLLHHLQVNEQEAQQLKLKKPAGFSPEAAMCHFNVWLQCKQEGGSVQSGWILGQDKNACFSEAIFHSIWKSPSEELVDVTPRVDQEKRVLFVPDHNRQIELSQYDGKPAINTYDNVRLQGNILVTPLTRIKVVMESDFVKIYGLWPW